MSKKAFEQINDDLSGCGLLMREGSMVNATINNAPSTTKDQDKPRDPEMHQTKKGGPSPAPAIGLGPRPRASC